MRYLICDATRMVEPGSSLYVTIRADDAAMPAGAAGEAASAW